MAARPRGSFPSCSESTSSPSSFLTRRQLLRDFGRHTICLRPRMNFGWRPLVPPSLPWGLAIFHHVCVAWRAAFSSPPREVGLPSFSRERRRGKKNERGRHDYFQVTGWFVLASVGALIVVEDATECNTSLKCKSLCMLKSLANNGVPLIGYVVLTKNKQFNAA